MHQLNTEGSPSLSHEAPCEAARLYPGVSGARPISSPLASVSATPRPGALSSIGITRLRRYYDPIRHPIRPGPLLAEHQLVMTLIPPPNRASRVALIPRVYTCRRHYPGGTARCIHRSPSPTAAAFPERQAGRLPHHPFRGLLSVHCTLRPVYSPSPNRARYTGSFSHFVTSITVPIATGWNDTCRVGVSPTEKWRLCTAH